VFLARDRELDRLVAIKVVTVGDSRSEMAARMTREARIVARLEHPSVVPIHDSGILGDGRTFYVMKFVEGVTLEDFDRTAHNHNDLLRIFQKICDALAFAHSRGIIHRDLKPANIMIGSFGETLVMDWGIACFASDTFGSGQGGTAAPSGPVTAHGTILGTAAFMPPEQARGEIDKIDIRSDVYSLGAVLYFLLTGKPPDESMSATVDEPRRHDRGISKALNAICLKAMAGNPADRYQNCTEFSDDIARALDQLSVSAYKENGFERLWRWLKRNRVILLIVSGYMLVRFLLYLRSAP
jgi:eukaryotic-like serine/threonine-protein kinase